MLAVCIGKEADFLFARKGAHVLGFIGQVCLKLAIIEG